nr:hypothetical protein [Tanacetum cinerariifolium]
MKPLSKSSYSFSDNFFISDGANRYGAQATGVAPGISCSDNSFISDGANLYGARATGVAPGI